MGIQILLIASLGASIYFFEEQNFIFGVLSLLLAILLLCKEIRREYVTKLIFFKNSENRCNCQFNIAVNLSKLLSDPKVEKALRDAKLFDKKFKLDHWQNILISNYKEKYKEVDTSNSFYYMWNKDDVIEEVIFNIKDGLLWKNGQINYDNVIHHRIFLPYDKKDINEDWGIGIGLNIQLIVVNGILKIQIGNFSAGANPYSWTRQNPISKKNEPLMYYKTYETIVEFPFMDALDNHNIPEKYLNFSMYALNSYVEYLQGRVDSKVFENEWTELNKERIYYIWHCAFGGFNELQSPLSKRINRKMDEFSAKRSERAFKLLENSKFEADIDEDTLYTNPYMQIFVMDYAELEQKHPERWADYFREPTDLESKLGKKLGII